MINFKLRDRLPNFNTRFFNLVISGLVIGTALGGLAQNAQAQGAGGKSSGDDSAKAMAVQAKMVVLEKRVKSLEGQILDLRTMIGTISSLRQRPDNRSGLPVGRPGPEPMNGVRPMNDARPMNNSRSISGPLQGTPAAPRFGAAAPHLSGGRRADVTLPAQRPNVREDGFDSKGRTLSHRQASLPRGGVSPLDRAEPANTPDAQKLYNDAYSHMLRRDYASAEKAFDALVKNHPQSRMAGNAQYWLGETYFVRGKYRPAADAFLKAYRKYSKGVKAPDSLMKLALSLNKLGQTGAACKTFDELAAKYPNAPNHVKQRAGMERRRAHCN